MLSFNLNIVQIFNIGAIINGLVLCFLLLRKKENKRANRLLVLLLLSLCFTVVTSLILEFRLYDAYPQLHLLPFTMTFWIGPTFYFYIRHLIEPEFRMRRTHLWHFSFIGLNYIHSIYHLIYGRNFPHPLFHNFTEAVVTYALIFILIYLFISYKNVTKYQNSILNQLSTTDEVQLTWIKQVIRSLSVAFFIIAIVKLIDYRELIDYSIDSYQGYLFAYRDAVPLVISLTIYWLGFGGYKQLQTVNNSDTSNPEIEDKDYSDIVEKLLSIMEEDKLYLNSALDLKMLSDATKVSTREISSALNKNLHKNFYWFVNEYRVEEAKKRISDPKYQHLKILSIAFDCGFNSKPTFNRLFKKVIGRQPKDFRVKT